MGEMDQDKLGEWLSAHLDGELDPEERALVDRLLRDDEHARRMYEELRRSVSLVSSLPRQPAPASIAEDLQAHAERATLIGDTYMAPGPSGEAPRSRSPFLRILAMAAMVALVAVGTWYVSTEVSPPGGIGQQVAMVTENRAVEPGESEAAERFAAAEKMDESIDRDIGQDMLAAAGFEQKLQNGMGVEAVLTHAFANEVVHLQVTVAGESDRDTVTAKLVAYLEGGPSTDLREIAGDGDDAARDVSAFAYYYEGKDGKNFSGEGERQILVRATRQQLDGLLDELARATGDGKDIALSAGPLSMKGLKRSRAALYGLDASPQLASRGSYRPVASVPREIESEGTSPRNEAVPSGGLLEGVLRVVGVDPELFTDLVVEPATPSAETDAPASRGRALTKNGTASARRGLTSVALGDLSSTPAATGPPGERFARTNEPAEARESVRQERGQPKQAASGKSKQRIDADPKKESGASGRDEASSLVGRRSAVLDKALAKKARAGRTEPRDVAVSNADLAAPVWTDLPAEADRLEGAELAEYITLVVRIIPPRHDSSGNRPRATRKAKSKPTGPRQ